VSHLPEGIHTGLAFFEACLEEKVIVVPGQACLPPFFFGEGIDLQDSSSILILRIVVT
jgi:hypothetical protein